MPPIVRLALWFRLIGSMWTCPLCGVSMVGGFGGSHCVRMHPLTRRAHASWVRWFDREVASLWA